MSSPFLLCTSVTLLIDFFSPVATRGETVCSFTKFVITRFVTELSGTAKDKVRSVGSPDTQKEQIANFP